MKGEIRPNDIDVALLISDESELGLIKEEIRALDYKVDIEIVDSIYNKIWAVLMKEGFSIRKNQYLFEIYGLKPSVLYKYNLKKLNPIQKVQFTRGLKSFLNESKGEMLSRTIVLVPINYKNEMESLLDGWGIKYESKHYELFPFLRKESFI